MTDLVAPEAVKASDNGDDGRGYGRRSGTFDEDLTRVGPGTPAGELFRRYWLPFATAAELGARPVRLRILGEDLVAFRDGTGTPGLLQERCMHRGTSLYYGKTESAGIRCCHHGWLYDVEGRCLEQPCEASQGKRLEKFRQPWYPVQERYGLAFTYLGPAEHQPLLPRYDVLELDEAGYSLFVDAATPYRTTTGVPNPAPYNWLQMNESGMDAAHVEILHGNMGGAKHSDDEVPKPTIDYAITSAGMQYTARRQRADGVIMLRVYENFLPSVHVGGNPVLADLSRSAIISWHVPVDDYGVRSFSVMRLPTPDVQALADGSWTAKMMGNTWRERSDEERQDNPGDYEAQVSQGPITLHSEEHLVSSDRGVIIWRKLLRESIGAIQDGRPPQNVFFDDNHGTVPVLSGNYLERVE